ncbi:hypothetical protein S1OALGB6SA_2378 [Olavius algarvensis spirochete endosymbiont]|uniref:flagellar protein FlaG n=1 Tax=Olavius algarvensis spirochete endosymbiont TaxID=260710 RepID=UPI000F1D1EBE|nr:flagellar protein FlaG [Olavius algarvensis spirochete endosymbiont]CAD7838859.1 MAG: hypothetical protein [Olavius algarvensis spirochete endosymbiont]VDB01276.1 hypothetical protein S1OALGB6SA_2378 [Olavius algarvensis spirochete endosymbiont]
MDVVHLTTAIRNVGVLKSGTAGRFPVTRRPPVFRINKEQLKVALDKIIRNTRFQYVLKGELFNLAVRIIDKDTDKVIREIPSRELQKMHENVERALGILFDELI